MCSLVFPLPLAESRGSVAVDSVRSGCPGKFQKYVCVESGVLWTHTHARTHMRPLEQEALSGNGGRCIVFSQGSEALCVGLYVCRECNKVYRSLGGCGKVTPPPGH